MRTDNILEIGIDESKKLYVKPETKNFEFIYRDASAVSWDAEQACLYSPVPQEMTYLMWYKQILFAVANEYGYKLEIAPYTKWVSISDELQKDIENWENMYPLL